MKRFFTSECVCSGHPDKVADQIADAILDAHLAQDPYARVACEVAIKTNKVILLGEITSRARVDYTKVVRETVRRIGYTDPKIKFSDNCSVIKMFSPQSANIDAGVSEDKKKGKDLGAGDQGIMFGYACDQTKRVKGGENAYMPLPIYLARRICDRLRVARESGELEFLKPDGKAQVTVEYEDDVPVRVDAIVCSAQHVKMDLEKLRKEIIEKVIKAAIPSELLDSRTKYFVNPAGDFILGGPYADSGLTGRKLISDTYGGYARHGGGSFSGKDCTKVDRSATYAARHAAKNIVAAGLASDCEIQLSYAIGKSEPVSIDVRTFGTGKISDDKIAKIVQELWDFRPSAMIERYKLRRPIFFQTAMLGHFGVDSPDYTWEQLDLVKEVKKKAGGNSYVRS